MLVSSRITRATPLAAVRPVRNAASRAATASASSSSPSLMQSTFNPTSPQRPSLHSQRPLATRAAPGEVSTATKPLELHVGPTTLSLPFNQQRAMELKAALALLLATFAEKAKAERPKRWQSLEYKFKNDDGSDESTTPPGIALFEVFCNPNAAASPFDAKVLVTVKSTEGGVGFTTEAPLSALRADLEAY